MAKPRIFISSTYYDLKNVRADLERFIRDKGFEPVLHERGSVPYGKDAALEEYCYREIGNCDILVALVGGRFGSPSKQEPLSISQLEFKTAAELQKPTYIFVERDVLAEFKTYTRNRESEIAWAAVNDVRVYKFLEEVFAFPANNPIAPFETSVDITNFLQEQWAGLFQRLLQESGQREQLAMVRELRESIQTLSQLVTYLTEEKKHGSEAITQILLMNHPAFTQLKKLLRVKYRVFFTNHSEMVQWLMARSYRRVSVSEWDDQDTEEWINKSEKKVHYLLKISINLFSEDGRLLAMTPEEWDERLVQLSQIQVPEDDDIPF